MLLKSNVFKYFVVLQTLLLLVVVAMDWIKKGHLVCQSQKDQVNRGLESNKSYPWKCIIFQDLNLNPVQISVLSLA